MNHTLTNPIGIDKEIQTIQTYLHDELDSALWVSLEAYGRAYKNREENEFIPETYIGNGEYKPLYFNDQYLGVLFFLINDDHTSEDGFKFVANIKICFMVDLTQIRTATDDRIDALLHSDVVGVLNNSPIEHLSITGLETGIRNIFRGYRIDQIENFNDIQPLHCFAIVGNLEYYLTEQCN